MAYAEQTGDANKVAGAKVETVQSVISSFERHIERMSKLAHHLGVIGDRLEGARPTSVTEASPETPPHCITDDLRRKHKAFGRLISESEEASQRIANALGL